MRQADGKLAAAHPSKPAHWSFGALVSAAQQPQSRPIQAWLTEHPRIQQRFIPVKAAWLNLMEPWWRLLRSGSVCRKQSFVDTQEVNCAALDATRRLNARAKPWVWGRPARTPGKRRRAFVYRL